MSLDVRTGRRSSPPGTSHTWDSSPPLTLPLGVVASSSWVPRQASYFLCRNTVEKSNYWWINIVSTLNFVNSKLWFIGDVKCIEAANKYTMECLFWDTFSSIEFLNLPISYSNIGILCYWVYWHLNVGIFWSITEILASRISAGKRECWGWRCRRLVFCRQSSCDPVLRHGVVRSRQWPTNPGSFAFQSSSTWPWSGETNIFFTEIHTSTVLMTDNTVDQKPRKPVQ